MVLVLLFLPRQRCFASSLSNTPWCIIPVVIASISCALVLDLLLLLLLLLSGGLPK
jgi:hypothetical protein